ncbi:M14 family metallopeptidase [Algibacter sp. 2305UL17-15]|uniref:M14 family metallopeptidase n=1 Tax=Algibacter sp. 2305UL17-15 TaxID=3231268 RepID=UPI003457D699
MARLSFLFLGFLVFLGCSSVKTVSFKTPIDTQSKPIEYQIKKTFELEDLGIYASNEFDGARLNGFEKLNDSTAKAIIAPENEPINHSAYYAFKVWSDTSKPFYIRFQYPEEHKHRYIPKLYRNNSWSILDSTNVYRNDNTVTVKIELNSKPLTISAQELKTYNDTKAWVNNLISGKDYVTLKSYGTSILGRDLPVLDIGIGDPKGKDVVVLLTRQHPPEVTGFYAYQYFLETILDDSQLSKDFLSQYHVLAFPILNPDGVDLGHWRHNAGGVDTNRDWSQYNQPEVKQTVEFITKFLKKNRARIVLGLDFHSTYKDVFYTNNIRKTTALPNFIEDWFVALEENIPDYKVNEAAGNSTKPVSKGWFLYGHNAVGITYEIGDATPKERIKTIGKVTAKEMMKILTKANNN